MAVVEVTGLQNDLWNVSNRLGCRSCNVVRQTGDIYQMEHPMTDEWVLFRTTFYSRDILLSINATFAYLVCTIFTYSDLIFMLPINRNEYYLKT